MGGDKTGDDRWYLKSAVQTGYMIDIWTD